MSKMKNFVPLSLYKYLATQQELPKELPYLTQEHLDAIKAMPLITRGRLSVQEASKVRTEFESSCSGPEANPHNVLYSL